MACRRIATFLLGLIIVYGVLMAPWPGLAGAYGTVFRATAQIAFGRLGSSGAVQFQEQSNAGGASGGASGGADTNVRLKNTRTNVTGERAMSSRYIGYVPTVILIALTLATPLPWRRRGRALIIGLLAVHAYIALRILLVLLWSFAGDHALATFSLGAAGNAVLSYVADLVGVSLIGCYLGPLLIWPVIMFRRGDWELMR